MQAEHPAQTCRKRRRETVFFDLDDTLYDRAVPYLAAFRQFFGGRYEDRAAQAFDAVIRRGYEVFKPAHTGQITMEQMHIYRHQTGLRDVGISVTPEQTLQLQALYAAQQGAIRLTGTMQAVLTLCAARFSAVGVITNGGVQPQTRKLESLGVSRWIDPRLVFISDAVGVMKPAPEIFRMAERAAGGPCIYIGDSCSQDVAGAAGCGWTTVWLNRRGEAPGTPRPDYTAGSERALLACLREISEQDA